MGGSGGSLRAGHLCDCMGNGNLAVYVVCLMCICGMGYMICMYMMTGWSSVMYDSMHVRMFVCLACFVHAFYYYNCYAGL